MNATTRPLMTALKAATTVSAPRPLVYSYARFSSLKQRKGSSSERQAEYAERVAAARGLTLDQTLHDNGKSAFTGEHIGSKGALGGFLRAIKKNQVGRGSVLIVESWDRLSRADPHVAMRQMSDIIEAGITIITAQDEQEYSPETLAESQGLLFLALGTMMRANNESREKSRRVREAKHTGVAGWKPGDAASSARQGGHLPAWVRLGTDGRRELVPERADAVRMAFDLFRRGWGAMAIANKMQEQGIKLTDKGTYSSYVQPLLKNRAVIGERILNLDKSKYHAARQVVLPDYYPPVITLAEFQEAQDMIARRSTGTRKAVIPHLFTGIGMTVCGYCDKAIIGQVCKYRDASGLLTDGARRIRCSHFKYDKTGCRMGTDSVSVVPLERAVLDFCSDMLNLRGLFGGDQEAAPRAVLATARERVRQLQQRIDVTQDLAIEAKLENDDASAAGFRKKAAALEVELAIEQDKQTKAERELARVARTDLEGLDAKFRELKTGVLAQETDARLQARQLIVDTFERVTLYLKGVYPFTDGKDPDETPKGCIEVELRARSGVSRLLRIDRAGGYIVLRDEFKRRQAPPLPVIA